MSYMTLIKILIMIWIVIIIAIVLAMLIPKKKFKTEEEIIISKMEKVFNGSEATEQNIHQLTTLIFEFCLNKSNKQVTLKDVTNPVEVMKNPKLYKYTAFFSAIKDSINQTAKSVVLINSASEKEKKYKEAFYSLTNYVISEMNKS